jgi:hypothetical protein
MCINPEHLKCGTFKENSNDRDAKGRHRYKPHPGEESWSAKLTEQQVIKILLDKRHPKIIALQYGVAECTIYNIKSGIKWRYLQEAL